MGEDPGGPADRAEPTGGATLSQTTADHRRLLAEVAEGSETALVELYRAFEQRIYAFGLSRLNDSAAAADLVNEVMVEVWKKADSYQGRSAVSTWILGIAHHRALDEIRRRTRRTFEELDARVPDARAVDPTAALEGLADREKVQACMEELSDAHREAIHLAFFEDLSTREAAEIAGCPQNTVKTRIYHAKAALKRCLAGLFASEDAEGASDA